MGVIQLIQQASLRLLLQGPVRFSSPVLAFGANPGDALPGAPACAPEARPVDGRLPVLGAVRMPRGLARGVERDGRVVSWAVAREPDELGVRSVTVETAPAYRGQGYARACLLALRRDCPQPLLYLCECKNLHSALTALSAGFFRVGSAREQTVKEERTMSALPFSTVDHVALIVSDYARSRAFYVETLGFSIVRENHRPDRGDWKLDLRCGDIELEIFGRPGSPARVTRPEACGLRHLAFRVPDLDAAVRELAARGIVCEAIRTDEFTGKRMTFFADPDGLPLEIRE